MSDRITIIQLKKTCDACPAQWEGRTSKNKPVYIRYRWDNLSISIGKPNEACVAVNTFKEILQRGLGRGMMNGVLSETDLIQIINMEPNISFTSETFR